MIHSILAGLLVMGPLAGRAGGEDVRLQASGTFYPSSAPELRAAVDSFLAHASSSGVAGELLGLLAPHAGYVYSGETAGKAYALLKGRRYDTVVILSAGHRYAVRGAATLADGSLGTPLGDVPIDAAMVKRLRALTGAVDVAPKAFLEEHAVEVQLPFLQRVLKGGFKVVPLLMNTEEAGMSREVGLAVAKVLKLGSVLLVVSSDLSHYPPKDMARTVDTASLAALVRRPDDPEYWWRANQMLLARGPKSLGTTYCGHAGVLAALFAMRELGGTGQLLSYTNSGELAIGDASRTVGYAALAWVKGKVEPKLQPVPRESRKKLLQLARRAMTLKVAKGEDPSTALWREPEFNLPEAVFVTLHRKDAPKRGDLRGCIGSLVPDMPLAEAVQHYAIQAALHDPRFPPVEARELDNLRVEISRLSPFRKARSHAEVRRGQGVVLAQGGRRGLFLPQVWDDLADKEDFLGELCSQKAHLPRDCWKDPKTEIQVFDDEAFEE
ncbi:MAG: AmmeMemoRadiSam system protein B [Elusimicrobia bacterium]|nr:AmmeMemoRadiSam system protein B [Elusimicrobiota bacterium]